MKKSTFYNYKSAVKHESMNSFTLVKFCSSTDLAFLWVLAVNREINMYDLRSQYISTSSFAIVDH